MFVREEQKILLDSFTRRNSSLGDIYFGGLRIYADETNPFRNQLAAHAFRELLDHLAMSTGEVVVKGISLGTQLMPVRAAFNALRDASSSPVNPPKDPAALSQELNAELAKLFDWQDDYLPKRREQTAITLTGLAGPGPALPQDVVTQEVASWLDSKDYFNSVAHGGKRAEREEFLGRLFAAEDIILRRVNPGPISELDEIDALIAEGEDAN
jgi:hypothetical protein